MPHIIMSHSAFLRMNICEYTYVVETPRMNICKYTYVVETPRMNICKYTYVVETPRMNICEYTYVVETPRMNICKYTYVVETPRLKLQCHFNTNCIHLFLVSMHQSKEDPRRLPPWSPRSKARLGSVLTCGRSR